MPVNYDLQSILKTLVDHEVEFILVGGLCAIVQGAPITTYDVDVVHRRTEENIQRLLGALDDLQAHYRELAERRIKPTASHLRGPGHNLLRTRLGHLDVLGTISDDRDFDSLLPDSHRLAIDDWTVQVLNLRTCVEMKEKAGRDKDLMALAVLKRTLELTEQGEGGGGEP